jgi:hypothetical protein
LLIFIVLYASPEALIFIETRLKDVFINLTQDLPVVETVEHPESDTIRVKFRGLALEDNKVRLAILQLEKDLNLNYPGVSLLAVDIKEYELTGCLVILPISVIYEIK